jgi:AcrR family transcriptional regulator
MARVNKRPEERRTQLLDCAQAVFFEKGYEAATINDIMARAGVSKGGFYHHFASKEELLEALSIRMATESAAAFRPMLEDPAQDALTTLNAFLAASRRLKVADAPTIRATFDAVFRPENILLYHRLNQAVGTVMVPLLAGLIARGRAQGIFRVEDATVAAEIVLQLGTSTHDVVARAVAATGAEEREAAAAALDERLRQQGIAIDRILGLPDGSVVFVEPGFGAAIIGAAPAQTT